MLNGERRGFELTPKDVVQVRDNIVQAIKEGRLSEDRVKEANSRIENLNKRRAL